MDSILSCHWDILRSLDVSVIYYLDLSILHSPDLDIIHSCHLGTLCSGDLRYPAFIELDYHAFITLGYPAFRKLEYNVLSGFECPSFIALEYHASSDALRYSNVISRCSYYRCTLRSTYFVIMRLTDLAIMLSLNFGFNAFLEFVFPVCFDLDILNTFVPYVTQIW